jgi:probable rRNA maturation factor
MILFDPEQSEAVEGFPGLAAAGDSRAGLPARPTLMRYLREAQTAVGLKGEVSVLLTTDEGIRALNRRFRKKNKATDVLSFPTDDPRFGSAGDLAISVETAARQAREQGHSLRVEVRVLMLHGLLHLAGMDHETDEGKMARKERRLREKLGLPMGLIERVVGDGRGKLTSGAKAPRSAAGLMPGLKPRLTLKQTLPDSKQPRHTLRQPLPALSKSLSIARRERDPGNRELEQQIPSGNDRQKGKGKDNSRSRFPSGMTERKARATAKNKTTERKARAAAKASAAIEPKAARAGKAGR